VSNRDREDVHDMENPGAATWAAPRGENDDCPALASQWRYRRQDGTCKLCQVPMANHDY
jgi:hypothetical protein